METSYGSITFLVPENYSAQLAARAGNGNISTDFQSTLQSFDKELIVGLGKGGAVLRGATAYGNIAIKRQLNN